MLENILSEVCKNPLALGFSFLALLAAMFLMISLREFFIDGFFRRTGFCRPLS